MAEKTIMDMFADMGKQFNLPKIDYDALIETHRKNIDAVQKSALAFSQGGGALLARQQEIFTEVMRQSRELIAEFKPTGSPQEMAAKQTELARRAFDAVVKNTRDIAELVQKSSGEAQAIIMNRIRESIAEARAAIENKRPDSSPCSIGAPVRRSSNDRRDGRGGISGRFPCRDVIQECGTWPDRRNGTQGRTSP
jgi:phasin family protein